MIQKYKLKKDARKFFDDKYHENIYDLETWKSCDIPIQVLDEVEQVYIEYGHQRIENNEVKSTTLRGWTSDGKKAEIRFTLRVSDIEMKDYDNVDIPELMDALQKTANTFFKYK